MEKETDQQYFLYFENYQKVLSDHLNDFLRRQVFVNVTLVCAGAKLRAHQSILSACSPLFESILTDIPNTHPVLFFNDISKEQMVALLEYMYRGQVNVAKSFLPALLMAARNLQIRGLEHEENNNSQESSPQFGRNGYQVSDALPEVPSQQKQTPMRSSQNFPATPNIVVRETVADNETPTAVPVPILANESSPKDGSVKVINPFAKKRAEDSDTTFCEDDLAVPGPSKAPTEKEKEVTQQPAANNDDSDIEFIENNPSIVVIPETQQDEDTPPWYRKKIQRNRRRVKREVNLCKPLEEADYTSDDSELVIGCKKRRINPVEDSDCDDEHSRVLVNPLALRSRSGKKNQAESPEGTSSSWLFKRKVNTSQTHHKRDENSVVTDAKFLQMNMSELGHLCAICLKFYKNIRDHTRDEHNTVPKITMCKKCSKKFNFREIYDNHICLK